MKRAKVGRTGTDSNNKQNIARTRKKCAELKCHATVGKDNWRCPEHSVAFYEPYFLRTRVVTGRTPKYSSDW